MNMFSAPALVLIDVQYGIDEADHWGGNRNNPNAEENIKRLLAQWRRQMFPVVIVQHNSKSSNSPFLPGQRGNDLKDFVELRPGDKYIGKSTTSAFVGTGLKAHLLDKRIGAVIICGFVTNNSVEATARHAGDFGFEVTVVSDAVACFDKIGLDGTMYDSGLVHQISLSNLAGEYASIKTTDEVIRSLGGSN